MNDSRRSARTSSVSTTDEVRLPGEVPLWEIPGWRARFGVLAGITGRGDDPAAPFDLGLWTGQPVGQVMERWRKFRASRSECPGMVMAHQVHGNRVLWHEAPTTGWTIHEGADGHATTSRGQMLLVTVADCVPVYLLAPKAGAIALLHAGWRGVASDILGNGIELLARHGVDSHEVVVHVGVAISGPCYEIGSDVMAGLGLPQEGAGPWHADLRSLPGSAGKRARSCRGDHEYALHGNQARRLLLAPGLERD